MIKVIGIAIIFVLFGSGAICIGLESISDKKNWKKWPTTEGTVTKFHQVTRRAGQANGKSPRYSADFDLKYEVDGKVYTDELKSSPVWSEEEGKKIWAKGERFKLRYNPEDPSEFLIKGDLARGSPWIPIAFGIVFILFISYAVWSFISD